MYIFRTSLEWLSLLVLCRICQIVTPGIILRSQTCSHLIILVSVVSHILLVQLKDLCFDNQFYNTGTGCYFLFPSLYWMKAVAWSFMLCIAGIGGYCLGIFMWLLWIYHTHRNIKRHCKTGSNMRRWNVWLLVEPDIALHLGQDPGCPVSIIDHTVGRHYEDIWITLLPVYYNNTHMSHFICMSDLQNP